MDIISRRYECHANNNVGNEVRHQLEWIVKSATRDCFNRQSFMLLTPKLESKNLYTRIQL
jgi:hypothetical protein